MNKSYFYLPAIFCLILFFIFKFPSVKAIIIGYDLILVLTIFLVFFLIKKKIKTRWMFLAQSAVFVLSGLGFFLFVADVFWQFVFGLIFILGLGYFFFHIFKLFNQPRICQPDALEKMSFWQNFIIIYWTLSVIGATLGVNPLNWRFFSALPLVFLLFYWLGYYSFYLKSGELKLIKIDLLIIGLVLTEIHLAINFLPLGFYLNALIISSLYGIIINIWQKIKSFV
ncbi:MAG: hypothetical protein PHW15_02395 [Patescibacteria group bacterium]|jgi:hypothetical protein|nr:hypothetical protein [Patescibacteria group bacterium]MDD5172849.1 hypothetical protein [Patescibacteria group bacterium]